VEPYDEEEEEEELLGWKICDVAIVACAKFAKSDYDVSHV